MAVNRDPGRGSAKISRAAELSSELRPEAPHALFISHPAAHRSWVSSFNSELTPRSLLADGEHAEHRCSMGRLVAL